MVAASNRAEHLDSALTRSGRFDRKVHVALPDRVAREKIFAMFLRKKFVEPTVSVRDLAAETAGFSGFRILRFWSLVCFLMLGIFSESKSGFVLFKTV